MLLKMEVHPAVIFNYWTGRLSIWVWDTRCSSLLLIDSHLYRILNTRSWRIWSYFLGIYWECRGEPRKYVRRADLVAENRSWRLPTTS